MRWCSTAVFVTLLSGGSSQSLPKFASDLEDGVRCPAQKIADCSSGSKYLEILQTLENAPILSEDIEFGEDEAQAALNELNFFLKNTCANCVKRVPKKELCEKRVPIFQGLYDHYNAHITDVSKKSCGAAKLICGKLHKVPCNGENFEAIKKRLESTSNKGGGDAMKTMTALNGFLQYKCDNCVKHENALALCETSKDIIEGIINYDDSDYTSPTEVFCKEIENPSAVPKSCADVKAHNSYVSDQEYMIGYPSFKVYCAGMDTFKPTEYVTLEKPNYFTLEQYYNYARGTTLKTTYHKIRIDPITLEVDNGDTTFAESVGAITVCQWDGTCNEKQTWMRYGEAKSCGRTGIAHIDLTGTSFHIPDFKSKVKAGGWKTQFTVTGNEKVMTFSVKGWCAVGGFRGYALSIDDNQSSIIF